MRARTLLVASLLTVASLAPAAEAQRACRFGSCVLAVFPAVGPIVVEGGAQGVFLLSMLSGVPAPELPLRPLAAPLDAEQQALLGCGPYWGTACEHSGIDLRNADAGVLMQSWFVPDGVDFAGDVQVLVPGSRGPFPPDGSTSVPPSGPIGGPFPNEMAATSYNFQMLLVAFSSGTGRPGRDPGAFDPNDPYALFDPYDLSTWSSAGQCSFLQPMYCSAIRAFFELRPARPGPCSLARPQNCWAAPAPVVTWSPWSQGLGAHGGAVRFGRRDFAVSGKGCPPARRASASWSIEAVRYGRCLPR
ncbi:MAG: hypothetical protein OZ948_08355 [Deltaproteobacteria bacterium]|nr:hypothetical protein [Deltaproteobacteria bacterium]